MRYFSILPVFMIALSFPAASRADTPATEFFAVETAKLAKLAPTDAALDAISSAQLSVISMAHGSYGGGLSMQFSTPLFRIDARFSGAATLSSRRPIALEYDINASNDQTAWNLISIHGRATAQGKQFVTEDWHRQPITVILRFLDLKH